MEDGNSYCRKKFFIPRYWPFVKVNEITKWMC